MDRSGVSPVCEAVPFASVGVHMKDFVKVVCFLRQITCDGYHLYTWSTEALSQESLTFFS